MIVYYITDWYENEKCITCEERYVLNENEKEELLKVASKLDDNRLAYKNKIYYICDELPSETYLSY